MAVDTREREFLFEVWNKMQTNKKLDATEKLAQKAIEMHPELHEMFENPDKYADYEYDINEPDPFSHLALHAIVLDMVAADSPPGLRSIYDQHINQSSNKHVVQHALMLAVFDWLVLTSEEGNEPDGAQLLPLVKKTFDEYNF